MALIGLMGAGKSTTGRAVARRLGADFVDTDDLIEARTGRTLRDLWQEGGEEAYRPMERRAVLDALSRPTPVVLATPGGVAVDDEMAAGVEGPNVVTIYLRASATTLAARTGGGRQRRPILGDDPEATLQRLLSQREERYIELADAVVDSDGRTPTGVVTAVLRALHPWWPSGDDEPDPPHPGSMSR
ncbi:shikimate kinase [Iamia sp.]|uniref:shikimate kinase n=1 Tax=Iamia sp. TaxID=2722710 RepID=UPI002CAEA7F5|nr:shikimate kinase [Iamia sp.]HXH55758.1 shikimate kinase [Iamia sp.]